MRSTYIKIPECNDTIYILCKTTVFFISSYYIKIVIFSSFAIEIQLSI